MFPVALFAPRMFPPRVFPPGPGGVGQVAVPVSVAVWAMISPPATPVWPMGEPVPVRRPVQRPPSRPGVGPRPAVGAAHWVGALPPVWARVGAVQTGVAGAVAAGPAVWAEVAALPEVAARLDDEWVLWLMELAPHP